MVGDRILWCWVVPYRKTDLTGSWYVSFYLKNARYWRRILLSFSIMFRSCFTVTLVGCFTPVRTRFLAFTIVGLQVWQVSQLGWRFSVISVIRYVVFSSKSFLVMFKHPFEGYLTRLRLRLRPHLRLPLWPHLRLPLWLRLWLQGPALGPGPALAQTPAPSQAQD